MIGTDQSLVERHSIWSRLIDLAKTHNNQLSSIDFSLASSLFVAALPADHQVTAKTLETERTGQEINADSITFSTAENSEAATSDDKEYDPYQESQDWRRRTALEDLMNELFSKRFMHTLIGRMHSDTRMELEASSMC